MLLSAHTMAENSTSGRLAIQLAVDARTCNIQRGVWNMLQWYWWRDEHILYDSCTCNPVGEM